MMKHARQRHPRRKIFISIGIIAGVLTAILLLMNMGRFFHLKTNDKWDSDQTNIIQYLYPASLCVRLAEQQHIAIDLGLKADLEKYTRKLFKKLTLDKLYSTQIGQLIWLNDYYQLDKSDQLFLELEKFHDKESHLYSFGRNEQKTAEKAENCIFTTCEIYGYIRDNPENRARFDAMEGLADFLDDFSDISYYGWGTVWQASEILKETGHTDLFDRNRIRAIIQGALQQDLFQNLMKGQYIVDLSMIGTADSLSDYMSSYENNTQYRHLCQEIYNKITTPDLIAYGKNDSLFPLLLASIRDVEDWSENSFISANYSLWLVENYQNAMRQNLVDALGE